jgi:biotin carboxyl carrier protein
MKFKLGDTEETIDGEIVKSLGNNEFVVRIKGKEHNLRIMNMTHEKVEFMLGSTYHMAKYVENTTAKITIVVDGVKITFNKRPDLDQIVYKNSGVESAVDSQVYLKSQIPGRVVSINVSVGDKVNKGEVVCILESMKMQVSIKSHKDGVVKSLKIKQGASVAKNDVLAEIE